MDNNKIMDTTEIANRLKDYIVDIKARAQELVISYGCKLTDDLDTRYSPQHGTIQGQSTEQNQQQQREIARSNNSTVNRASRIHPIKEFLLRNASVPRPMQYLELSKYRSVKTEQIIKDANTVLAWYYCIFMVFEAHLPMIDNLELEMIRFEEALLSGDYTPEMVVEGEDEKINSFLREINILTLDIANELDRGEAIFAPAQQLFGRLKRLVDEARPLETEENAIMITKYTEKLFEITAVICRTALALSEFLWVFELFKLEVFSYWHLN